LIKCKGEVLLAKQVVNGVHIQLKKKFVKLLYWIIHIGVNHVELEHGWNQYDHEMPSVNSAKKQVSFSFIVMK
jgi:hypothetical protein